MQYLLYLICFCFSLKILYVDSRVTLPRSFINSMTGLFLTRLSKIMITYLAYIRKTDIPLIYPHFKEYVCYSRHVNIVSLLVLLSIANVRITYQNGRAHFGKVHSFVECCFLHPFLVNG